MIARISGGNSGIAEYLEDGLKNGRDFSREQLDQRVILDGNLELTNQIINSIQDKDQDRYLHITLSFREDTISHEQLNNVVNEYKSLLMSAYKDDEFNFYAEAHIPKIKTILDKKTGALIDRKPHIHIVIPKINLLSNKSLNPFGLYTKAISFHDAIQEHINNKYNLESPKDFIRQDDNQHAEIISRFKGDFHSEKQGNIKNEIHSLINKNNIKSMDEFKIIVSNYGETKTRNKGKDNEYLAVKFKGQTQFTNLKSPLFSKEYIEKREFLIIKKTPIEIEKTLTEWKDVASREIKHVVKATPSFRTLYKNSTPEEKQILLNSREDQYDKKYRPTQNINKEQNGRTEHSQPSFKQFGKRSFADIPHGLPSLPERNVVHPGTRRGDRRAESILPNNENNPMVTRGTREYPAVRRTGHRNEQTRRIEESNISSQSANYSAEKIAKENDLEKETFKEIRKHLDPKRLLNELSNTHGIDPEKYILSIAKDGSSRINVGKLNLNVSDFLTKHMNLKWEEAKPILEKCYQSQKEQALSSPKEKIDKVLWKEFNKEYRPNIYEKAKENRKLLRENQKELRSDSWNKFSSDNNQIFKSNLPKSERNAALSIAIVNRLQREELIREHGVKARNSITSELKKPDDEHFIDYLTNRSKFDMGIADKLKKMATPEENGFKNQAPQISIVANMERLKKDKEVSQQLAERLRMNDLFSHKKQNGVVEYKSGKDNTTAFTDNGESITFSKNETEKDKIALGLEVAIAKYGNVLKLTGSEEFKARAVEVAAEQGLKVMFTPDKYQEMLISKQNEMKNTKEQIVEKETPTVTKERSPDLINDPTEKQKDTIKKDLAPVAKDSEQPTSVEEKDKELQVAELKTDLAQKPEPPLGAGKTAIVIEYQWDDAKNKFAMTINDKPANEVMTTELVETLSKNKYLSQYSKAELMSGMLDPQGKGAPKNDVLDDKGGSIKQESTETSTEEIKKKEDLTM